MAGTKTLTKTHGGKSDLASRFWDVALATDWQPIHVVEPYCGGAAFTLEGLARDLPYSFVINDLNRALTTFWRVLQSPEDFADFARMVEATPFSEAEFKRAQSVLSFVQPATDRVMVAWAFFVVNRQSLAGRMKGFTGITKTRVRRRMNNEVSAWLSTVDDLPWFHSLLRKVLVLDARPALEVIVKHDTPDTLFYVDPPYVHSTRSTIGEYAHEMSDEDHRELWRTLVRCQGKWMLSGYPSALYDDMAATYSDIRRHDFAINNHAAGGKTKEVKTEGLWCNFASAEDSTP